MLERIKDKFYLKNRELLSTFVFLFILSFSVRLLYVNHNSPYIFHPDEPTIVNSTINLRYDLNPKHFDWPTLTYYINYPIYIFFEKLDAFILRFFLLDLDIINFFNYYLITRLLTATIGSLAVSILFLTILNFGINKSVSYLSAIFFSLSPFFLSRSSQSLPDVPMLFFGVVSLFFISKHFVSPKFHYLIFSAFSLGLSVSSKYTGYLFGLTLAGYLIYFYRLKIVLFVRSGILVLVSLLGFFVGTPYALLDLDTFLINDSPKGALWQFQNVGKISLFDQVKSFFNNLFLNQIDNFGYFPLILVIFFIFITLYFRLRYKKNLLPTNFPIAIFLIFTFQFFYIFWSVSGLSSRSQRAQHFLPALPFVILIFSFLLNSITFKYRAIIYVLFILINMRTYLGSIEMDPIVKYYYFYKNSQVDVASKNQIILYKEDVLVPVLSKMGYIPKKNNEKNHKHSKYVFSISEICKNTDSCNYNIKYQLKNSYNDETLYIYERISKD